MASLLPSPLVLALPAKSLSRWFQLLHPTRHRGSAPPSCFLSRCSSRVPSKASTGNNTPDPPGPPLGTEIWGWGSSCSTENHPKPGSLAGDPGQLCGTGGAVKNRIEKNNQKPGKITGLIFTCAPGVLGHLTGSGELCTGDSSMQS